MATALVIGVVAPPALAGPSPAPPTLALVGQDAFTALGGAYRARVRVEAERPELYVSVVAHQAITTRSAFDRTTADEGLGSVISQVVVTLADLPATTSGERELLIPLTGPGQARSSSALAVRSEGVYPLAIELRDAEDRTLDRFVSYLVAVRVGADGQPVPLEHRLGVAWVWPLAAAPVHDPDGRPRSAVVAEFEAQGRLGLQAAALDAASAFPVTLVPAPETLESWVSLGAHDPALAAGAAAISHAPGNRMVLGGPYVPIDLPALLRNGMGAVVDAEYAAGDTALEELYGQGIDGRTALARPVDVAALDYLRSRGVERVIVDEGALDSSTARLTTAAPFALEGSAVPGTPALAAVASDTRLARLLAGRGSPGLRAQQFLAGLSVVAREEPGRARAVVVANPEGFDPPSGLLDALVPALTSHPWLQSVTVATVFDTIAAEGDTRALVAYEPLPPPVSAAAFFATSGRVAGFASLVGADDHVQVKRAEDLVLASVSAARPQPVAARQGPADLAAAEEVVASFLARIRVPAPGTITLTARSGKIPLTFRNDTGRPVRIAVTLSGRNLVFPEGSTRAVELDLRSTTVSIPVQTRSSGTFPLHMVVSSSDGGLVISDARFRVRSTAVSSVGIGLMVGAIVFLVGWWALHIRRRHRARAVPQPT